MNNLIGTLDQCLPPAYDWVESLNLSSNDGLRKDAWNLVPVSNNNHNISLLIDGFDDIENKIKTELDRLGWQSAETTQRLIVDGYQVLVTAVTKIKTNPLQVSRQLGIDAASGLTKSTVASVHIPKVKGELTVADIFEGLCVGFDTKAAFKSKKGVQLLKDISVPSAELSNCQLKQKMAKALIFTKWLQDAPSNFLNSEQFAAIADEYFGKKAKVTVLGREEMLAKGMGAFMAVAAGAQADPKLVTVEIKGKDTSKTVALVGKGVTFDAGGINIKPTAGLEEMKFDMSGAAAVYGAAHYLTDVQPPVNVVCAIGAVENMPSGTAIKPGDVVRSASGKTVEILNTDAEGRLVLADVLTHVIDNYKPGLVIDIATLTGAVLFGLGHAGAAYMTGEDQTADFLNHVGKQYGEALWRLPLWPELEQEVSSDLADIKNLPKPNVKAGTIMGGWFLKEFVKDADCQWAHVDIAGTAWNCSATGYLKAGGSSYGVRTLVGACESYEG